MIMTVLTGDFALDASIAGLPSGVGVPACNRPAIDPGTPVLDNEGDSDLKLYLRHVERGESIRSLAREAGCHASTILRRIRRFEARRDDPLVDEALAALEAQGAIRVEYGGLRVLDLAALRSSIFQIKGG